MFLLLCLLQRRSLTLPSFIFSPIRGSKLPSSDIGERVKNENISKNVWHSTSPLFPLEEKNHLDKRTLERWTKWHSWWFLQRLRRRRIREPDGNLEIIQSRGFQENISLNWGLNIAHKTTIKQLLWWKTTLGSSVQGTLHSLWALKNTVWLLLLWYDALSPRPTSKLWEWMNNLSGLKWFA